MNKDNNLIIIIKNLIESYIERLGQLSYLASLEARLAGRTLLHITGLLFIAGFLLASIWFSLLLIVFFYLISLYFSALTAAVTIACINILVFAAIVSYIFRIKKNLFFPATRRQISNTEIVKKDV